MERSNLDIKIYVACLAAYNIGILYGRWINALQSPSGILADVSEMLKESPIEGGEEWAIHDYEGFEIIALHEYQGFETVSKLAFFIEEHGKVGALLYEYFGSLEDAQTALKDHYHGVYESVEDFARELTEDTTDIPENLSFYIDYEKMARDMAINDILVIEEDFNRQHIFWRF